MFKAEIGVLAVCSLGFSGQANPLSLNEIERQTLGLRDSVLTGQGQPIVLQDGEFERSSVPFLSLDGTWELVLADGRRLDAEVPGTMYAALWKAGAIDDPYFGTNDLKAATYSERSTVWRRRFAFSPQPGARYRLSFEGVSDTGDFSLNGVCLGSHMGMFGGPDYELPANVLRADNLLEVRLNPILPSPDTLSLSCVRGWHYCRLPSIGIWRSVRICEIPAVEVRRQFIATHDAESRAMEYRVEIDAAEKQEAELRLSIRPVGFPGKSYRHSERVSLKKGSNALRYSFALSGAELWWPAGHGAQRLYEITASVGRSSVTDPFGVRTFRFLPGPQGPDPKRYNRVAEVNGRRLFLKGAGWCTPDALLRLDEPMYRRALDRALEQHVNFLRAWGQGLPETDTFYSLCDRLGFLVLQEFPLSGNHYNKDVNPARRDAAVRSVRRMRNHPSLAVWGGGNEFARRYDPDYLAKDELVKELGRIALEEDGTRDFWVSDPWGGSEHHHISWSGWTPDQFLSHYAPRAGTVQNEYGLDTLMNVRSLRKIAPQEEWDMFPWRHFTAMAHHTATFNHDYIVNKARRPHGSDVDGHLWFGGHYLVATNLASFVLGSQIAQVYATAPHAMNARTHFPALGMNTYYKLNDVFPGSSWAVVDWFGAPKLAHYALKRAQRPLCAAIRLAGHEPGEAAKVPVYLLDDAGELGRDRNWQVKVRFYDRDLHIVGEKAFEGKGLSEPVHRIGSVQTGDVHKLTTPSLVSWDLTVEGAIVSRDFAMLNVYEAPGRCADFRTTALTLGKEDETHVCVANVGPAAAVGVMLDVGEAECRAVLEDNFFFLPAGESRRIAVSRADDVRAVFALNAFEQQSAQSGRGKEKTR